MHNDDDQYLNTDAALPQRDERKIGTHTVSAVGYDGGAQRFIVRTSRGAAPGQQSGFTMPYAYLAERHLSDEFWTMRKLTGGDSQ